MVDTSCRYVLLAACVALVGVNTVCAAKFAVERVTNFGDPITGSRSTPLAVLNDQLLFLAIENGKSGLYRTDGTNVALIDNSVEIPTSNSRLTEVKTSRLGDELYFSAQGSNGRELYATDGQSLRRVTDIYPGAPGSFPSDFQVVNDLLVFNASTGTNPNGTSVEKFFYTDGTNVGEFPVRRYRSDSPLVQTGDRFVFVGSGQGVGVYSMQGTQVTRIETSGVNAEVPIVGYGNQAYVVTGGTGPGGRRIYRTDGLTTQVVASLNDLVPYPLIHGVGAFSFADAAYLSTDNLDELAFFRIQGDQLVEVLRWAVPSGSTTVREQPFFVSDDLAVFSFTLNHKASLFSFDGETFQQLGEFNTSSIRPTFFEIGDRVFVSVDEAGFPSGTYEIVNGTLEDLGKGLTNMAQFHGEVFGSSFSFFGSEPLWQLVDGQLVPVDDRIRTAVTRFTEFNGKLYFNAIEGQNQQMYAVVPVPEPSALALLIAMMTGTIASMRRSYASPNRR